MRRLKILVVVLSTAIAAPAFATDHAPVPVRMAQAQFAPPASPEGQRQILLQRLMTFVTDDYLGNAREGHENFADLFADTVTYYGRPGTSRARVMADKRAFYRRWPLRRYELIPGSLQPNPGPNDSVEIAFRYTYEVSNGRRSARGIGTTTLGLILVGDGRYQIVKENGGIIRRTGGT